MTLAGVPGREPSQAGGGLLGGGTCPSGVPCRLCQQRKGVQPFAVCLLSDAPPPYLSPSDHEIIHILLFWACVKLTMHTKGYQLQRFVFSQRMSI